MSGFHFKQRRKRVGNFWRDSAHEARKVPLFCGILGADQSAYVEQIALRVHLRYTHHFGDVTNNVGCG